MGVLMASTSLGVRRRAPEGYDAHGERTMGALGSLVGPWPGRARRQQDGSWHLAVDDAAWPLQERDVVVEVVATGTGREWLVTAADVLRNTVDSTVDYVRVEAQERRPSGTEPGGGVGPYGD
jgi:hypothetical protein